MQHLFIRWLNIELVVGIFFFCAIGLVGSWLYSWLDVSGGGGWVIRRFNSSIMLENVPSISLLVGSMGGGWYIVGNLGPTVTHASIGDA